MLQEECKTCKKCIWLVGLGLGIRCRDEINQHYKPESDKLKHLSVLISDVPSGCQYYVSAENDSAE